MGSDDLENAVRRALARLPSVERELLLELVGASRTQRRAASSDELLDTLTHIALASRKPGRHRVVLAGEALNVEFGSEGELLDCAPVDPLWPLGAGVVSGLTAAERPTAFALIVSLAAHGHAFDGGGRRDLVSLISAALADALTRR